MIGEASSVFILGLSLVDPCAGSPFVNGTAPPEEAGGTAGMLEQHHVALMSSKGPAGLLS